MPMPSRMVAVWSMSLAAAYEVVMVAYSLFEAFDGLSVPAGVHIGLEIFLFSPRSVSATMFRVLVAFPLLLVTQISTRLMLMPVVMLGNVFIASSYLSRK